MGEPEAGEIDGEGFEPEGEGEGGGVEVFVLDAGEEGEDFGGGDGWGDVVAEELEGLAVGLRGWGKFGVTPAWAFVGGEGGVDELGEEDAGSRLREDGASESFEKGKLVRREECEGRRGETGPEDGAGLRREAG